MQVFIAILGILPVIVKDQRWSGSDLLAQEFVSMARVFIYMKIAAAPCIISCCGSYIWAESEKCVSSISDGLHLSSSPFAAGPPNNDGRSDCECFIDVGR